MLFWYTPQIVKFNHAVTQSIKKASLLFGDQQQSELLGYVAATAEKRRLEQLEDRVCVLEREMATRSAPSVPASQDSGEVGVTSSRRTVWPSFHFIFQEQFRGPKEEVQKKLSFYLLVLRELGAEIASGPWLDIGCGRGEWLELAEKEGFQVVGIDSNPLSVRHCEANGLQAKEADGLEYLSQLPENSLGGVTAFHIVEHWKYDYTLQLFQEVYRVLAPSGVLLVETPHPGNVGMATHDFWLDPTHERPLPISLLRFLLEFSRFEVIRIKEFDRRPPSSVPPYAELPFIEHLNRRFYGPQDYGVIAKRSGSAQN